MRQSLFDIRCEWGEQGLEHLQEECDVIIIVDVLSFSTCVSVATNHGAKVIPATGESAQEQASSSGAQLAVPRSDWQPDSNNVCLSPVSMHSLGKGDLVVLPSPNGAKLSEMADRNTPVLAGCLRNSKAVAAKAMHLGSTIGVIPAGERWADGSLRPAWEDLIGAGAIINELDGERSPESAVAEMAYLSVVGEVYTRMSKTVSGRELIERGFKADIELACIEDSDDYAPRLIDGAYQ